MSQPEVSSESPPAKARIYTKDFVLLFMAELTVFAAFYTLLPIIPLYILELGGTEAQVGLLLAVTGVVTLFAAPMYGRAVDVWGRKRILLIGLVIGGVVATSFTLARSAIMLVFPLFGRSLGSSVTGTASRTLIFDIAPPSRRGEAIATFMLSHNFAIAFGPAMGLAIMSGWGFRWPFFVTAALCAVSFMLVSLVREPQRVAPPPPKNPGEKQPSGWFVREAMFPAVLQFLLSMSYGSTIQFLAVMGEKRDIESYQIFFSVYAVVVITVRFLAGRVSDRYGRAAVLLPSLTSQIVALLILSQATTLPVLILAAVAFGGGWGAAYPTLTALTADRVDASRRGVAMGLFSSAMAFGSAMGSAIVGFGAQYVGFSWTFAFTASMVFLGLIYCATGLKSAGQLNLRPLQPTT